MGSGRIRVSDPTRLSRRLERLKDGMKPASVMDEFIEAQIPIHFGGMSDPFMPMERKNGISLAILRALGKYKYPTVISTKSTMCGEDKYVRELLDGNFVVQISIPTLSDKLSRAVDVGAPTASQRLNLVRNLSLAGVPVTCRLQPLLPGRESEACELVHACAMAGARQISVEHLKLGVENTPRRKQLSAALGADLVQLFSERRAVRIGREWVLPTQERLARVIDLRNISKNAGMFFGAADNDLLHLSDGKSCCSSVDLIKFEKSFRFTFTQAIKNNVNGLVRYSSIRDEWRPSRSIARYVNSNSRIRGGDIESYVRAGWNGSRLGLSPLSYYGVEETGDFEEGFAVYSLSSEVRSFLAEAS